ncbi:c-type cytochrome [Sphingomonas sp. KC8]|uniref:c-type cytochrome n=1 Tax=Sphingomonas sp. KC8 TaxID=1030157 RepID=UPI0002488A47|nr:c-type cytochrome [Sphingomonas sp. KC8]ARS25729.1 class I cytochrome c [Sphingomonas sp. KC8]
MKGVVRKLAIGLGLTLLTSPVVAAPLPKPPGFAVCSVCHKVQAGASSTMGPNLWAVGGRKAGEPAGYSYSPAMKKYAQPWTRANLITFLTDPRKVVPGNKMAFAGQKDPKVAAAMADYLLSLK